MQLGDIQETMLIPVVIKASETQKKCPKIVDSKAVEIVEKLAIDSEKFDKPMSHHGVVARTVLFDAEVINLLKIYPEAQCINLGCGLDNRFQRVDNGRVRWWNVDLPDAMAVRRQFFSDSAREKNIVGSALETDWLHLIPSDGVTIIIIEGVLMYFSEEEVKKMLHQLIGHFKKLILVVELMHPAVAKQGRRHETVKHTKANFQWGVVDGREVAHYHPELVFVKEESFNKEMKKYNLGTWLFGTLPFLKKLNNRLAVYRTPF